MRVGSDKPAARKHWFEFSIRMGQSVDQGLSTPHQLRVYISASSDRNSPNLSFPPSPAPHPWVLNASLPSVVQPVSLLYRSCLDVANTHSCLTLCLYTSLHRHTRGKRYQPPPTRWDVCHPRLDAPTIITTCKRWRWSAASLTYRSSNFYTRIGGVWRRSCSGRL